MNKSIAIHALEERIKAAAPQLLHALPLQRVLNEWEVVFLLGSIAKESGFQLFIGSESFPDAILEVQLENERVQIEVELEYRASRFNHNVKGCDAVICWRNDTGGIGDLPIIELKPLFPILDKEKEDLQINHESMDPNLREMFFTIQDWLSKWKLIRTGTGSKTETSTITFKWILDAGQRSLCSLQYYKNSGYLQFKWFKDTIQELGKSDKFLQSLSEIRNVVPNRIRSKDETNKEYRINLYPEDNSSIAEILKTLESFFDISQ